MKLRAKFESGSPVAEQAKPTPDKSMSPAARNLALAHHLNRMIEQGLIADYTAAARLLGVSQPRLTHLMSLLLLAPTIQEAILVGTLAPADKKLRRLARLAEWREQLAESSRLWSAPSQ
jgi:predicted XRE-type DNA-binding protein